MLFPILFFCIRKIILRYRNGGFWIIGVSVLISLLLCRHISPNYIFRLPIIVVGILTYLYEKEYIRLVGVYVFCALFLFFINREGLMLSVVVPIILKGMNDIELKLSNKFLDYIGAISFELYLAHIIPMNFLYGENFFVAILIMLIGTASLVCLYKFINTSICRII